MRLDLLMEAYSIGPIYNQGGGLPAKDEYHLIFQSTHTIDYREPHGSILRCNHTLPKGLLIEEEMKPKSATCPPYGCLCSDMQASEVQE